jgi:hypothetical protein
MAVSTGEFGPQAVASVSGMNLAWKRVAMTLRLELGIAAGIVTAA